MLRGLVKPITFKDIDAPPPMWQTLARLFTYLRPYRRRMVATLSIYVVCVVITQLYPFIDRKLIDEHIAVRNTEGFLPLLGLATVLHALAWVGVLIRSLLIQRISLGILVDLRRHRSSLKRPIRRPSRPDTKAPALYELHQFVALP